MVRFTSSILSKPERKVEQRFSSIWLDIALFSLWFLERKKRVAKIQEQIVIAEEIMGDTQTCVFFLSFFR